MVPIAKVTIGKGIYIVLCSVFILHDSSTLVTLWPCYLQIPSPLSRIWLGSFYRLNVPFSEPLHIHSRYLLSHRLFPIFSDLSSYV